MMAQDELTGLILAGGQGRRMGGVDKGLVAFRGRPLVAHVRDRLLGRVAELLINANRSEGDYAPLADRVIGDAEGGYQGPLMGIYSGLRAARGDADIAVAWDGERLHPVVALIRTALADDLAAALADGERKIDRWYARHAWCRVDFSDCPEAFANLNTDDDRRRLEADATGSQP